MSCPFRTIRELIDRRYRVPLAKRMTLEEDWEPHSYANETVELWELLDVVERLYRIAFHENKGLRKELQRIESRSILYDSNPVKQEYFNELFEKYNLRMPIAYPPSANYSNPTFTEIWED